jgi:hypothetical protein
VKEYDVFVPLKYNDGTDIETSRLLEIQTFLLEHFDGLTFFPQPNDGFWKMGGVTYRDEIVIYRVLASSTRAARRQLRVLKRQLMEALQQEEMLTVERDVETL